MARLRNNRFKTPYGKMRWPHYEEVILGQFLLAFETRDEDDFELALDDVQQMIAELPEHDQVIAYDALHCICAEMYELMEAA